MSETPERLDWVRIYEEGKHREEQCFNEYCLGKQIRIIKTAACYDDTLRNIFREHGLTEKFIIVCKNLDALSNVFTDAVLEGRNVGIISDGCQFEDSKTEVEAFKKDEINVLGIAGVGVPFGEEILDLLNKETSHVFCVDLSESPLNLRLFKIVGMATNMCTFTFSSSMLWCVEHKVLNMFHLCS